MKTLIVARIRPLLGSAIKSQHLLAAPVAAFVAVAGCDGAESPRHALVIGADRNATHGAALADTARAFAGDSPARRRPDAAGDSLIGIDPEDLSPGGQTNWHLATNVGIGLRHEARLGLRGGVELYGAHTLALGKSGYLLPDGIGVLTDPARVAMTSLSLQPEVGLARGWAVGRGRVAASAGLGLQLGMTRTTIRSALLDVRHASVNAQPYAVLGLSLQPEGLPALDLQARVARDGLTQLRGDIALPLGLR